MKLAKGILLSALSIGVLTGCGVSEEDQAKIDKYEELATKYEELKGKYEDATGEKLDETTEKNENPTIGEYFEVEYTDDWEEIEGLLGVKVVSVVETDERTSHDEDVEHVAVLELELTNKTGVAINISEDDFNIIDGEGFQGRTLSYGTDTTEFSVDIPKDGKARARFRYEVGTPGPYSVQAQDVIVKKYLA